MFGAKSSPIKKRKRRQAGRNLGLSAFFMYPVFDWYGGKFGPGLKRRARRGASAVGGRFARKGAGAARGAAAEAAEVAEVAVL